MLNFIINQKTITNQKSLIISGTATTNSWDRGSLNNPNPESLTVTPNAMKKAWEPYQQKGAIMLDEHGQSELKDKSVGKWLSYIYEPEDYQLDSPEILEMKIKVICEIQNEKTIQQILSGEKDSFSMAWTTKNWLVNQKTGQRIDTEIEINELTVTGNPANKDATFTVVTDEKLLEQYNLQNQVKVYNQKSNIKEIYKNDKGQYFADVEISNLKSVAKVPLKDIQEVKGVVIPNYKMSFKKYYRVLNTLR